MREKPSRDQRIRLLPEEQAAHFTGWALRKFRKFDLPFVQPPGTRRRDQRLYSEDVLKAWRDEHGTYRDVLAAAASRTHRQLTYKGEAFSNSQHYHRYMDMKSRCTNVGDPDYDNYGGRGITIHPPWLDDPIAFFQYLDSIGPIPKGHTLDRINNDGHYEPGNLQFVDAGMQNANRRPWADGYACCDCDSRFCDHDAAACPVEAFEWAEVRRALVLMGVADEHAQPFDWHKARRNYDRQRNSSVILLPAPPQPNRWDELLERIALERWVRDELVLV